MLRSRLERAVGNERLKAFSDGVVAILITILVLEIKAPHGEDFAALFELWPIFLSYVLSFVYIGIYWNNHHHLLNACTRVNGAILWANLHLLFWLSLLPFATAWMDESHGAALPAALYGLVLLLAAVAWYILEFTIIAEHGRDSVLARALGADWKAKLSPVAYIVAIGAAFVVPMLSQVLFVLVALVWLVPDRRIERALREHPIE